MIAKSLVKRDKIGVVTPYKEIQMEDILLKVSEG